MDSSRHSQTYSMSGKDMDVSRHSARSTATFSSLLEDDSHQKVIDEQLTASLLVIQKHEADLSKNLQRGAGGHHIEFERRHRPVHLANEPHERILPQDLVFLEEETYENEDYVKAMMTMVCICDEVSELQEMAESEVYSSLEMFGQRATDNPDDEFKAGERERIIGAGMPQLQKATNFAKRCNNVAVNIVQQLVSCSSAQSDVLPPSHFSRGCLDPLFLSLGDLLCILMTMDVLVLGNSVLNEAWAHFKAMMSHVRMAPDMYETSEEAVSKFERMLVNMDTKLFSGELFRACIEQDFEPILDADLEAQVAAQTDGTPGVQRLRVSENTMFLDRLMQMSRVTVEAAAKGIGAAQDANEEKQLMAGFGMYALFRRLCPPSAPPDYKLYKFLWSVQKVAPFVVVGRKDLWVLAAFMTDECHYEVPKLEPSNAFQWQQQYVDAVAATFAQTAANLTRQALKWCVTAYEVLQSCVKSETIQSMPNTMNKYGMICHEGITLAKRISTACKQLLSSHVSMSRPLSKTNMQALAPLFEALEYMGELFKAKQDVLVESLSYQQRLVARVTLMSLEKVKNAATQSQECSTRMYLRASIEMLEHVVNGTERFTGPRLVLAALATNNIVRLSSTSSESGEVTVPVEVLQKLSTVVRRMAASHTTAKKIRYCTDTSFLFFHNYLLTYLCAYLYEMPGISGSRRLSYLVKAFCGSVTALPFTDPTKTDKKGQLMLSTQLRDYIIRVIREEIVRPLCHDVETDLRLHVHSKHLRHMDVASAEKNYDKMVPIAHWIRTGENLEILGKVFSLSAEVAHYLNQNFYNLTTVALHDWRTYSEMRALAREKYGLQLLNNFLPMGSLDQGLDVLQIMRNIHIFVARFAYNLNSQEFVEYKPDQTKHINTIKTQNIAASIRQHGLGVLNTTVNFTYQYLVRKFEIFSRFLNDKYIIAHVSKERRGFRANKKAYNNMYPYKHAVKFVKDIRTLGTSKAGKSFLDEFRKLITEIGNALGYVRMVRSAAMVYSSDAVKFVPDLDKEPQFEQHASGAAMEASTDENDDDGEKTRKTSSEKVNYSQWDGFSGETKRAAKNLDSVLNTLVNNFTEGNDYFKVLVNVFQTVLLNADGHDHLKDFYLLVPPLCISWMDNSLSAIDSMYKVSSGRSGAATTREIHHTDDGFAMGIAYCLAILKQTRKYESLHWKDSVRTTQASERARIDKDQADRAAFEEAAAKKQKRKSSMFGGMFGGKKTEQEAPVDVEENYRVEEEVSVLQMSSKKLEAQRRAMEQLFFSMSGAGIFFRRNDYSSK